MRLVRWIVVSLGIAAFVRWLRRRREEPVAADEEPLEDPADELRRKLAESRAESPPPEPPASPDPPAPEASVDERRADIHAQGRETLTEMTPPGED